MKICDSCGAENEVNNTRCRNCTLPMARYASKAEAIADAAQLFAEICAEQDRQTPEEIAEGAYIPGGPTREEIADLVRQQRAEARAQQHAKTAA